MSEYGYLPDSANIEQSFGNNKGILTPKDIYDLTRADKYTNYGQLELIETQTVSSAQNVDFISLGNYNVHLLTVNNHTFPAGSQDYGIRFFENGVLETASVYQYAIQQCGIGGSYFEAKSTGANHIRIDNTGSEQWIQNWYCYFYNLSDSSKYSFTTSQKVPERINTSGNYNSSGTYIEFGSGVLPQASVVDGIRIYNSTKTANAGTLSLYGIKEYS